MFVSAFDLFKLGVGPSSSHTMGPMTAATRFIARLRADGLLDRVKRVETKLYASLALTGKGHATDRAVILGLAGFEPLAAAYLAWFHNQTAVTLAPGQKIEFFEGV